MEGERKSNKATFGMGCFWRPDEVFTELKEPGILKTTVGYTGGTVEKPSYEQVCTGRTGHAEAIQIEFDSEKISYGRLLELFWKEHDPTTMNQQGVDVGSQYRSAIFYHDEEQKQLAEASRDEEQKKLGKSIVTQIVPAGEFYPAEDYHQKYYQTHGSVCH